MGLDGTEQLIALTLTFVVHVAGAALLIWAMIDRERDDGGLRGWWPRDDGPGGPGPEPPRSPAPSGPLPLPDAEPSRARLREEGSRIGDAYPRPARRPDHVPGPSPRQPV